MLKTYSSKQRNFIEVKILLGKLQIALKKCKGNSRSINAGQLKHEGAIEYLIHLDEGFQFLRDN